MPQYNTYPLSLAGTLESTGTGLDQTLFLNMDTAREMSRASLTSAEKPLEIPADKVSAVMVKAAPGADLRALALKITRDVPGVTAIESPNMFQSARKQMAGLLRGFVTVLGIIWLVFLALIGLIFSITANERLRQIGVLRALGCTVGFAFRSLLAEAALLALGGALLGIAISMAAVLLFRDLIVNSLRIPFVLTSPLEIAGLILASLVVSLGVVSLAALLPAIRVSRQDPALAMRE